MLLSWPQFKSQYSANYPNSSVYSISSAWRKYKRREFSFDVSVLPPIVRPTKKVEKGKTPSPKKKSKSPKKSIEKRSRSPRRTLERQSREVIPIAGQKEIKTKKEIDIWEDTQIDNPQYTPEFEQFLDAKRDNTELTEQEIENNIEAIEEEYKLLHDRSPYYLDDRYFYYLLKQEKYETIVYFIEEFFGYDLVRLQVRQWSKKFYGEYRDSPQELVNWYFNLPVNDVENGTTFMEDVETGMIAIDLSRNDLKIKKYNNLWGIDGFEITTDNAEEYIDKNYVIFPLYEGKYDAETTLLYVLGTCGSQNLYESCPSIR